MKTKLFLLLSALLTVSLLSAQDEQKIYLPVLDEGVRFYFATEEGECDGGADCRKYSYFECRKDVENENIYQVIRKDDSQTGVNNKVGIYNKLEVSEDNSKLWGISDLYHGDKDLLMDLNLNVGDMFNGFMVGKIYQKDGRKHIEFYPNPGGYCLCIDEDNAICQHETPFTFIEGIGPNVFFGNDIDGSQMVWIYARYKNGELEYGIEGGYQPRKVCVWNVPGMGCAVFSYTCKKLPDFIKETKIDTLPLLSGTSGDKVQIKLPENIHGKVDLTICDLSGRNIETVAINGNSLVLDISHYASATYIAKLSADNWQYVGKIIKK